MVKTGGVPGRCDPATAGRQDVPGFTALWTAFLHCFRDITARKILSSEIANCAGGVLKQYESRFEALLPQVSSRVNLFFLLDFTLQRYLIRLE